MKELRCEKCGAKFNVSGKPAGTKLRCSRCQNVFEIPAEPAPASAHSDMSARKVTADRRNSQKFAGQRKKSNMLPVFLVGGLVLVAGIVVSFFVLGDRNAPKQPASPTPASGVSGIPGGDKASDVEKDLVDKVKNNPKDEGARQQLKLLFERQREEIDTTPVTQGYLRLAKWCHDVGLSFDRLPPNFREAAKRMKDLLAADGTSRKPFSEPVRPIEQLKQEYARKRGALLAENCALIQQLAKLLEWSKLLNIEEERVGLRNDLLDLDENNPTANEDRGWVLFGLTWEDRTLIVDVVGEPDRIKELDKEHGPGKGINILLALKRIRERFPKSKWNYAYAEPYVIIIEESNSYNAATIMTSTERSLSTSTRNSAKNTAGCLKWGK